MSDGELDRIKRQRHLFEQALEIEDAAGRADFLAQACGDDRELWQELQALLAAEEDSPTEFMEPQEVPIDTPAPGEQPGDRIGPYTLIDQLGDGAFGVVWRAEQSEPVQREVALKIIKPGMDSSEVVARFEAERQALALMDHPSIAQVYDAGTTDLGRPYFVMELVRGVPITNYCTEQNLSIEARLRLFIEVCRAVQHAHQKGVIHRDLKPSNILVVEHEGKALPKVIDFGIAKAIDQELASRTLDTLEGAFLGTPQYMSPEQTGVSGTDIDTRADVYALGAILYELLTGSTPLTLEELKAGGWGEMERLIREQEPAKPSVRTTTLDAGKTSRHLRGDLDWVVMRALEKDRDRRYETANEVARELEHFLANEPVSAGPPTFAYRTKKFLRRNRTLAASLATIAVVLVAAAIVSSVQAVRATRAENAARGAEAVAIKGERALASQLSAAITERAFQRAAAGDPGEACLWHLEALRVLGRATARAEDGQAASRIRVANALAATPPVAWIAFLAGVPKGGLVMDPKSRWVAVRPTSYRKVVFLDAATGQKITELRTPGVALSQRIKIDPTGRLVAVATDRSSILLMDANTLDAPPLEIPLEAAVSDFDFSFDGKLLAVTGTGGVAFVVDTVRHEVIQRIEPMASGIRSGWGARCFFSPTDHLLALVTQGVQVGAWYYVTCIDADRGEVVLPHTLVNGGARLTFSPDSRYLASYQSAFGGHFWDLSTGEELASFPRTTPDYLGLLFDEDRITLCFERAIKTFSFPPPFQQIAERPLTTSWSKSETFVIPSPDQAMLLVHNPQRSDSLLLIEAGTAAESLVMKSRDPITTAAFSPGGDSILHGTADGTIRLGSAFLSRPASHLLATGSGLKRNGQEARCAAFTPDGAQVVGVASQAGDFGTAMIWDATNGVVFHVFDGSDEKMCRIAATPDGSYLVTGTNSGIIQLRDPNDVEKINAEFEFGGAIARLDLSPTGTFIAAKNAYGARGLRVWNVRENRLVAESPVHESADTSRFLFTPDDAWGLGSFQTHREPEKPRPSKHLVNLRDGTIRPEGPSGLTPWNSGKQAAFTRDGKHLLIENRVYTWEGNGEAKSLHSLSLTRVPAKESSFALANDDRRVAVTETDGSVRIWDLSKKILVAPPIGPEAAARILAFSPDDRWLATGSRDGTVRIWSVASGKMVAGPLQAGQMNVVTLQFNPQRPLQLLTADASGRIALWDLDNPIAGAASFDDLRTAAEILSNRRIDEDGVVVPLGKDELRARWEGMNETVRALVTRKNADGQESAD